MQHEQSREVEEQIVRDNETGRWLTGAIAVVGLLSFVLDGSGYGFAALLVIAVLNLGYAWQHRIRRRKAFAEDLRQDRECRELQHERQQVSEAREWYESTQRSAPKE